MLRVEARNAETPIERKPSWIRTTAKMGPEYTQLSAMVKSEGIAMSMSSSVRRSFVIASSTGISVTWNVSMPFRI